MTTNQEHPITPPLELVEQWEEEAVHESDYNAHLAARAAQWGSDQELIACGNYLKQCASWEEEEVIEFYNYRRPKPPGLKEQALTHFESFAATFETAGGDSDLIRRALESIND